MKNYRLVIPSGHPEITIGMQYGNVTLKNGQILPESDVVRSFPQYFVLIPEAKPVEVVEEVVVAESIEEIITETPVEPVVDAPVKRKAGRPKKTI